MTPQEIELLERRILIKEQLIEWTREDIAEMKRKLEAEKNLLRKENTVG